MMRREQSSQKHYRHENGVDFKPYHLREGCAATNRIAKRLSRFQQATLFDNSSL
jgi:hypothetical protein